MAKRTALYDLHIEQNARMVNFGGWDMPLHYGSQLDEHHQVRRSAGMFDVSHMTILDVNGPSASDYLRRLLANDVAKLDRAGTALYGCMLNQQAGVVDDLITYLMSDGAYRIVVNAATREKDLEWMHTQASEYDVVLRERDDLSMIAVQGPEARDLVLRELASRDQQRVADLSPFAAYALENLFIARTGYTGEDGFEVILPSEQVPEFWQKLLLRGVRPVGLGARDTLRLEAGLNLYGTDMDENITPLECGLGWTVAWEPRERDFIGRHALETQRQGGVHRKRIGLVLEGRGVLRSHQRVIVQGVGEGEITSGTYSPTLKVGIALARVPEGIKDSCQVEIRGKTLSARVVSLPFVRQGKSCL
jgi:aminomethyltransferase